MFQHIQPSSLVRPVRNLPGLGRRSELIDFKTSGLLKVFVALLLAVACESEGFLHTSAAVAHVDDVILNVMYAARKI